MIRARRIGAAKIPAGCIDTDAVTSPRNSSATDRPNPHPGQNVKPNLSIIQKDARSADGSIKAMRIKAAANTAHSKCKKK